MILRLQTEEELTALQQKLKAKLPSRMVHATEPLISRGTSLKNASRKPHKGPSATFEHQLLARQLIQAKIAYREEFRFEPKRRWKADFLVDNFLVEIVGGLWMKRGGHSQGQAQLDDMEKFNHAAKLGYRVLQFSPDQVKNGDAIGFIEQVLA